MSLIDTLNVEILDFLEDLGDADDIAQRLCHEFELPLETAQLIISHLCTKCRRLPRYYGKSLCRACINAGRKQHEQIRRNERTGFMSVEEFEASQGE